MKSALLLTASLLIIDAPLPASAKAWEWRCRDYNPRLPDGGCATGSAMRPADEGHRGPGMTHSPPPEDDDDGENPPPPPPPPPPDPDEGGNPCGGNCGVGWGNGGGNGTGNEGNGQGPGDNGNGNGPPDGHPGGGRR